MAALRHPGPTGRLGPWCRRIGRVVSFNDPCDHLALSSDVTPTSDGCEECLRTGDRWVHLRVCMHCGHVGCCDSSPNRHATAHWKTHPYHPLVRSYEPGEDWWWCYADRIVFYVDGAPPAPSHP